MRTDQGPRRGFVLATTLLVMTLLTVILTAAFVLAAAEFRTTDNVTAVARAHALAQAGLQEYLTRKPPASPSYDSSRIMLAGGYADILARRVRDSTAGTRPMWVIRSTGIITDPFLTGQTQARRTVAQLVWRNPAGMPVEAAVFAANGMHIVGVGGANPIQGNSFSFSCLPLLSLRPGLITPTGGYTQQSTGSPGGSPGIRYVPSAQAVIDSTRVDWPAIVAGNFIPDWRIPPDNPPWTGTDVYYVEGDYSLLSGGVSTKRGVLIVTGNLFITGNARWEGVVIVGGYARGLGTFRVSGMLMTGMNISLGHTVPPDTFWRGPNQDLHWRHCDYRNGIATLEAFVPIPGAFMDTWSGY